MARSDAIFVTARAGPVGGALVLVPGLGGDPGELAALAAGVAGDFAILIPDLRMLLERAGDDVRVESLARLAFEALGKSGHDQVRAFAGFSFGGLVALEMARLAHARPGPEPVLILIDAAPEQSHWPRAVWLRSARARALLHLRSLRGRSWRSATAEVASRAVRLLIRLRRRRARPGSVPGPVSLSTTASPASANRLVQAYDRYEPTFYPGRAVLLESTASPLFTGALPDIWRPLTAGLERHRLPGGHLDLLRSPVSLGCLTARLNACLGLAAPPPV